MHGKRHSQQDVLQSRKRGQQIECLKNDPNLGGAEVIADDFLHRCDVTTIDDNSSCVRREDS